MLVSRLYLSLLLSSLMGATSALAADPAERLEHHCLNKAEQRVAVATHKVMPLAEVMKNRHKQGHHGELVRARLCREGDGLVYVLTLLGRSGRVLRVTVDAENDEPINSR